MDKLLLLLLLVFLIAGCGDVVSSSGYEGDVEVYELEDGTKCAVFVGFAKGGISCDWNKQKAQSND